MKKEAAGACIRLISVGNVFKIRARKALPAI
jgi:hypothetical protein